MATGKDKRKPPTNRSDRQQQGQNTGAEGTLASGYSSRSSTGGTPGDMLRQGGSDGDLAREGVTAGAAGIGDDARATQLRRGEKRAGGADGTEDYDASDGGRAVGGVSGTSGGGSGTTPANNTRK